MDIVASVLNEAIGGTKKTHIMYKCNLSFKQLQVYMDLLIDRGLLKTVVEKGGDNDREVFETTAKGEAFLNAYRNLNALLSA